MTDTYKVLGQVVPVSANTQLNLYTVPVATSTSVSSLVVCNQAAVTITFRARVKVANAADTAAQYLFYDVSVPSGESFIATIGITLAATDVIAVQASSTTVSFTLFGAEIS